MQTSKKKEATYHESNQLRNQRSIHVHVYDAARRLLYHAMSHVPNVTYWHPMKWTAILGSRESQASLFIPIFIIEKENQQWEIKIIVLKQNGFIPVILRRTISTLSMFRFMWVAFTFFNTAQVYYITNLLALPDMWVTIVTVISIGVGVATYPW